MGSINKKIVLAIIFLISININLIAVTIEENTDACNSSNMIGCYNLGVLYNHGKDVKQDYIKAIELYTKACDGGCSVF